jgi:hypothetical protein
MCLLASLCLLLPTGDQGENPSGDLREFKNITLCVKPLSHDKTLETKLEKLLEAK